MFQNLSDKLSAILNKLCSKGVVTPAHLDESMKEIRNALLDADVSLRFVNDFATSVRDKIIGQKIIDNVNPGHMIVKLISDELVSFLSSDDQELNFNSVPPARFLMLGLQGSGKTTSSAKLAYRLQKQGKRILLVSLDIYRPAAREQLSILASQIGCDVLDIVENETVPQILARSNKKIQSDRFDVVIYDTAGRMHIDDGMMVELEDVKKHVKPVESILVLDSMTGQDAVNIAHTFHDRIGITGVILSRIDGDTRGGAALSVKYITGAPIKFLGVGEKIDALEEFSADRLASRILGMGDIVALVERAQNIADEADVKRMEERMMKGKFNMNDYKKYLHQVSQLGGISSVMSLMPNLGGMGKLKSMLGGGVLENADRGMQKNVAIVDSMTKQERKHPEIIGGSRKKRIAAGSGTSVNDVNNMIKQYESMASVVKKMKNMDKGMIANMMAKLMG